MERNLSATLRNIVYNGGSDLEIHQALLEAAGALEDIEAEYENKMKVMGTNAYKIWHCFVSVLNDMQDIANTHMLCDCCKYLRENGTCGDSSERDAENC